MGYGSSSSTPSCAPSTPGREWNFGQDIIRMPEFCAPALSNRGNLVTMDAELPEKASGVLYALGGSGGGLTWYVDDGYLCYEYNQFILQRTKIRSEDRLPADRTKIEIPPVRRGQAGRLAEHHETCATEPSYIVGIAGADHLSRTQRNPVFPVVESGVSELRAATR